MRKDAAEKKGTLLRSAGCVGSRITSELFTKKLKHVVAKCYPALLLRSNRSLLMQLWRRFFAFSSLWTGALVDTGREHLYPTMEGDQFLYCLLLVLCLFSFCLNILYGLGQS
jgi:hypothetical protein